MERNERLTVKFCHTLANNCQRKWCLQGFLLSRAAKYCCTIDYNADLHRRRFSLENGIDQLIAQSTVRDENQFNQDDTFTEVKFVAITSANGFKLNTEVTVWQCFFDSRLVRKQPCIVVQRSNKRVIVVWPEAWDHPWQIVEETTRCIATTLQLIGTVCFQTSWTIMTIAKRISRSSDLFWPFTLEMEF